MFFVCVLSRLSRVRLLATPPCSFASGSLQARILEWVTKDQLILNHSQFWKSNNFVVIILIIMVLLNMNFCSVQFSSVMSDSLQPHESQHARPHCPSPTSGGHSDSRPLSQWCHPIISSSVVPFSSCPHSFPASGSYHISQLFASGGQSIGVLASTSVPPMNTQDWSPEGWTGTVQKHQFFDTQLSL